ncbi:ABC transporter ATP-binding protein [Bombiscardovia apis]|uniref:ABC transporter ATP-binding protein n=1 Tax=Bombiscardovia apis TaxID=2932182 RepID=A0ABN6SDX9_9BIFI|nr:phosphatase domain-containing protein [Bombiscardovia apis]BDR54254.1 ABC transporter ATP-binding protein [Bombiscardovia apis]
MSSTHEDPRDKRRPIRARHVATSFDAAAPHERFDQQSLPVKLARMGATTGFDMWARASAALCRRMGWYPRVEPYVGYGTEHYSRLICRTVLAPPGPESASASRGIWTALTVPAPHTRVSIAIDSEPLETVQLGDSELYDAPDPSRNQSSKFARSDRSGYLDLVAEHDLSVGPHQVTYHVNERSLVPGTLYTVASSARIGVISDVDDTIMVTQAPSRLKAGYNLLLSNPTKRASVPGMSVLYTRIRDLDVDMPFFYLSASPWNVERTIRLFIRDHGFPAGPLLLRDLDPRPKTFVPTTVQHKHEFIQQLMADFPKMRFILFGDDGQRDPTTYAEVVRRYPGRILAIGIRQLSPRESSLPSFDWTGNQPAPEMDVPVFYGTTGANLMKTMLPYLQSTCRRSRL